MEASILRSAEVEASPVVGRERWHTQPAMLSSPLAGTTERTSQAPISSLQPDPIVRPEFPDPVQDRSPIAGVSAEMRLRTCFRIGEALNAGCEGVRSHQPVIIELYARTKPVRHRKQPDSAEHLFFQDLFHDNPPFLHGVRELCTRTDPGYQQGDQALIPNNSSKVCRCVGRMKKDRHDWVLLVLGMWEASWADINYAAGIVCV